jgi:hypothetical protein
MSLANFTCRLINSIFFKSSRDQISSCMQKYELRHTHEVYSIDTATDFWNIWNREQEEDMRCVHDYVIETLS